jgi:hypothetical protein
MEYRVPLAAPVCASAPHATKFFMPMSEDPNQRGGSRRWIIREVETPSAGSTPATSICTRSTGPVPIPTWRRR